MDPEELSDNFNARAEHVLSLLDNDPEDTGGADAESEPVQPEQASAPEQSEDQPRESEDATSDQELPQASSDREPVIAAPESWPQEQREKFSQLPSDLQKVIAEREADQKSAFNRHVNEAVEAKRVAEATRQSLAETLNTYLANAVNFDPVVAEGVKTNWAQLAQDDPMEYVAKKSVFDQRVSELQEAQRTRDTIAQQQFVEVRQREAHALLEKAPDWARDPSIYQKEWPRIVENGVKQYGLTGAEMENVSDHRYVLVLRDALRYRETVAAQESLVSKKAPPQPGKVQAPGGAGVNGNGAGKATLNKLARTSSLHDRAELLADLI